MSACAAIASLLLAAPPRPTTAALERAVENAKPAIVEVVGPRQRGTGVVVGAQGQVLTSTRFVSLTAAQVHRGEETIPAKVVMANASLGVALVAADPPQTWASAPVALSEPLPKGTWLLGLRRSTHGDVTPVLGKVAKQSSPGSPFVQVDILLDPGSPLLDAKGRLVAVAVAAIPGGSRALVLSEVKLQLQESPP